MSIGFRLNNQNDAVVWRGPRKNGHLKQFLLEVAWGDLDFLIIDSKENLTQLLRELQTSICHLLTI